MEFAGTTAHGGLVVFLPFARSKENLGERDLRFRSVTEVPKFSFRTNQIQPHALDSFEVCCDDKVVTMKGAC